MSYFKKTFFLKVVRTKGGAQMLHTSRPLYFPALNRFGETSFKSHSDQEGYKTTELYTLNWEKLDLLKKAEFSKHALTHDSAFPGTLPEEYDGLVKKMIFAIPSSYLKEIRRSSYKALTEWDGDYSFDTVIREMCLQPAIAHVQVAFRLIADCLYDPATNYFSREPIKIIATQALLYKFWAFQTGRGLIREHANFEVIERLVNGRNIQLEDDSSRYQIRAFIQAIECYEKELNKLYQIKRVGIVDTEAVPAGISPIIPQGCVSED